MEGPLNGGILDYSKKTVRIRNFNTIQSVLFTFGDLIQFLDISFEHMDKVLGKQIGGFVTKNCTESLVEFHLRNCYENVLDELTESFGHVNIATFSTHRTDKFEIGLNTLQLSEMFPKLRRLYVRIRTSLDWGLVGDEFPHLRTFSVELPEPDRLTVPNVEKFLKGSPQINSLTLRYTSLRLLKAASQFLSQLNILHILDFSDEHYEGSQIQFRNVSRLNITLTRNNQQIPQKLAFYELRMLSLNLNFDFTNQWIQPFAKKASKSIDLLEIQSTAFRDTHLTTIAAKQPNIKLAFISSDKKVSADAIVQFLEKCHQLSSLHMQIGLIDMAERQILEERLIEVWNVDYYYASNSITIRFTR